MTDKVQFKAKQMPTGIIGAVMFQAEDEVEKLSAFLKEQHRYANGKQKEDPLWELYFEVQVRRWYKRRSIDQNALQWELCSRLGQADGVTKEVVHSAIKEILYPSQEEYLGVTGKKDGSELTTIEFGRVIEELIILCQTHDPPVEIRDIWILFYEWRFGQTKDPLEGTYGSKKEYKEKHPCCEADGRYLLFSDSQGVQQTGGEVAHIVSDGSGGQDADYNWLQLCTDCHRNLIHQKGWDEFIKTHPHLEPKVTRARERSGKAPVDARVDTPVEAAPDTATPEVVERIVEQVDTVRKVFGGTVVGGTVPSVDAPDEGKQIMMDKLTGLEDEAAEKQKKYYHKDKTDDVADPKKSQYHEEDK